MPWTAQGSRDEVYTKNERLVLDARIYSNSGEQVFALDGSPVLKWFLLWISQVAEIEGWV
jgi:hypothetical protein